MPRLIDADVLSAIFQGPGGAVVRAIIDKQPTVTERTSEFRNVHLSYDGDDDDTWECSDCGCAWIIEGNPKEHHYHYCPNCGAGFKEATNENQQP